MSPFDRRIIAAALASVCAAPAFARAEQPSGDKDGQPPAAGDADKKPDKAAARRRFERARKLHDSGQYREAASAYLEAYDHFPAPAFLYNAGQVYRLAGDYDLALDHYRRYLELDPNGEAAADARQFIAELEAEQKADPATGTEPDPHTQDPPQVDPPDQPDPPGQAADTGASLVLDPEQPMADPTAGYSLRISGLIVAGVGVASLAAGAGFAARANSINGSLSGHTGPWTDELDDEYRAGQSAERYAVISFSIGSAALVTGAVLYWVGRRRSQEGRRPVVQLSPTPGGAAAWLSFRY